MRTLVIDAFASLGAVGIGASVGGAGGYIAALTGRAIAPEKDINRINWGTEGGFLVGSITLIGVAAYWVTEGVLALVG